MQGKDAVPFLETLVVGDVAGITNGFGSLSVFTNEKGGIIDDTVITKVLSGLKGALKRNTMVPLIAGIYCGMPVQIMCHMH